LTLLYLALLIAILDWLAVARGWRAVEYVCKPAVMLALLAWLAAIGGLHGWMLWFGLGLALSLAGDVLLMLPREHFIAGLLAFLLAHIAYIAGFNQTPPPFNLASLALALPVGLAIYALYPHLASRLRTPPFRRLRARVLIYATVISIMLFSALLTLVRTEWPAGPAILASLGALLFFLSDLSLAWNRFVRRLPHGRLQVMIPYHLGQIGIILGAAYFFLRTSV
jgi:uncharacterized membrane protein YhhN